MHQILKTLRRRFVEAPSLAYLQTITIVNHLHPAALPAETVYPALAIKDGDLSRDVTLQQGVRERLTVLGQVYVQIFNPGPEAGPVIGDEIHGLVGVTEIIDDLTTVVDGDVTSLTNCTDIFLKSSGPSEPLPTTDRKSVV